MAADCAASREFVADLLSRPRVITLCGSTKFMDAFERANEDLTLQGNVVFSVAMKAHEGSSRVSAEQKQLLDRVHLEKIRLADEILVLNVNGYIGESTAREIAFANQIGRVVRYLEPVGASVPK
jgi:hypothetical protein